MSAPPQGPGRFYARLNLALILLVGFFVAHAQIRDYDLWWHLAAGRWMLAHHAVPRLDPFSFTSAGNEWVDLHWLFELMLYGVFRLAGGEGLLVLLTLIFLAALALVLIYGSRSGSLTAAVIGGLFMILVGHVNFVLRAHLLSILFSVLMLNLLACYRRRQGLEIYLLAPVMLVWVNCHSLFAVGCVLMAAWGLGEFVDALRQGRVRAESPYLVRLALASCLAVMVCLINPYGADGFLFPLTTFSRISGEAAVFQKYIIELTPPLRIKIWVPALFFYKLSLALLGLVLLLRFSKVRTAEVLVSLCFGYLSYRAFRNLSLWAAVMGAVLGRNLGELIPRPRAGTRWAAVWFPVASLGLSVVLLAQAAIFAHPDLRQRVYGFYRFGLGFQPGFYPVRTTDFLEQHPIAGRGFNCLADGGYLLWRLFPERQVFFDGRLEVRDAAMFETYIRATRNPRFLETALDRFQLQYALIRHDYPVLIAALAQNPKWAPVCLDQVSLLLVRRSPENQALIDRYGLDWKTLRLEQAQSLVPSDSSRGDALETLGTFFKRVGREDLTRALYVEATQSGPGHGLADSYLGAQALAQRRLPEARVHLEAALPYLPENQRAAVHSSLAEIAEREADFPRAIRHLNRALADQPDNCYWHERLGHDYLKARGPEKAGAELQKSLRCPDPAPVQAKRWAALAVAWAAQSRGAEARQAAFHALFFDPTLQPARRLYEDLRQSERGTKAAPTGK